MFLTLSVAQGFEKCSFMLGKPLQSIASTDKFSGQANRRTRQARKTRVHKSGRDKLLIIKKIDTRCRQDTGWLTAGEKGKVHSEYVQKGRVDGRDARVINHSRGI